MKGPDGARDKSEAILYLRNRLPQLFLPRNDKKKEADYFVG
jgi:hypothetical protein